MVWPVSGTSAAIFGGGSTSAFKYLTASCEMRRMASPECVALSSTT
jgi:hypothetical protein